MSWRLTLGSLLVLAALAGPAAADVIYAVRQGDSLEKIAEAYGLTQEQILRANPELTFAEASTPGTMLVLPEKENLPDDDPLEEALIPGGSQLDSTAETLILIKGNPAYLNMSRSGDRHKRMQLASRRGNLLRSITGTANRFVGVPYSMGGTTSRAFDCSGFVMRVFLLNGIKLPRTADVQYNVGKKVAPGDEQAGDLVFFETYLPGPSHVGIYLGNRQFIHASSSRGVTISSLAEGYFRTRYIGAKRVF
ncbi:MAG: LysM peptidoglycan-binding domain-containing C40 family peptidase [Armatimonadetes bacterium]|nr:LysM peptidoglycan-binding domain-containing C40 family peptidase [Armatimonadota bacterium]